MSVIAILRQLSATANMSRRAMLVGYGWIADGCQDLIPLFSSFSIKAVVYCISGILPSHRSAFFNSAICPAWYTACCVVLWKSR